VHDLERTGEKIASEVEDCTGQAPTEADVEALRAELHALRSSDKQAEEKHLNMVVAALSRATEQCEQPEHVNPRRIPCNDIAMAGTAICEGSFGRVLSATWSGQPVALKDCTKLDQRTIDSLENEATILERGRCAA